MRPLFRIPCAPSRTGRPTARVRHRKLTLECLETRALLSTLFAAPAAASGVPVAGTPPTVVVSSPVAAVAASTLTKLRHAVAD